MRNSVCPSMSCWGQDTVVIYVYLRSTLMGCVQILRYSPKELVPPSGGDGSPGRVEELKLPGEESRRMGAELLEMPMFLPKKNTRPAPGDGSPGCARGIPANLLPPAGLA